MMRFTKQIAQSTVIVSVLLSLFGTVNAAKQLTQLTNEEMDRVTAGVRAFSSDSNSVFRASASAEGATADASANVNTNSARANSGATTNGTFVGGASSVAQTSAIPQPQTPSRPTAASGGSTLRARIAALRAKMQR